MLQAREAPVRRTEPTDFDDMADRYDCGRSVPLTWLGVWREAIAPHLDIQASDLRLLDLGAGTGLFASAFVRWFDVEVVAVEPSGAMRREALRKRSHPRIHWIAGRAEQLPLRDGSLDCAWLSTVVHHIPDLALCARELRRVLRPNGPVLVRNAFAGRTEGIPWLQFFTEARPLAEARWPTVEEVVTVFQTAGFEERELAEVAQVSASNLHEYADRALTRADSTLSALPDELFDRGLTRLQQAAAVQEPSPVITRLNLLVLQ